MCTSCKRENNLDASIDIHKPIGIVRLSVAGCELASTTQEQHEICVCNEVPFCICHCLCGPEQQFHNWFPQKQSQRQMTWVTFVRGSVVQEVNYQYRIELMTLQELPKTSSEWKQNSQMFLPFWNKSRHVVHPFSVEKGSGFGVDLAMAEFL